MQCYIHSFMQNLQSFKWQPLQGSGTRFASGSRFGSGSRWVAVVERLF